jgi:protein arginine N-methyltransferase 1
MAVDSSLTSSDYYWHSYSHFSIHEEMLKDRVRTESYRRAIQSPGLVKDKVVLDVGCGTGILSLFAAAAGARKVYAIDCAEILEQARQIVKANHWEHVIVLIKGRVEDVEIPEKVDVLISEWMGYFLMYESMLSSVIFARDKWLKPGGVVLPNKCSLYINAIEDAEYKDTKINWWRNVYGFDMGCISEIAMSEPLVDVVEPHMVVTDDCLLKEYDISTTTSSEMSFEAPFTLRATREECIHAVSTYFDTEFTAANVRFSTGPAAKYTHWKQAVMYLKDVISMRKGEKISGTLACKPNACNPRDLDLTLTYNFNGRYQQSSATQHFWMR